MSETTNSSIDVIARTCIAARMRLLNRVVTNFYDDALRPLGLKVSQLNILIVTADSASPGPPRSARFCNSTRPPSAAMSNGCRPTAGWRSCRTRGRPLPSRSG